MRDIECNVTRFKSCRSPLLRKMSSAFIHAWDCNRNGCPICGAYQVPAMHVAGSMYSQGNPHPSVMNTNFMLAVAKPHYVSQAEQDRISDHKYAVIQRRILLELQGLPLKDYDDEEDPFMVNKENEYDFGVVEDEFYLGE